MVLTLYYVICRVSNNMRGVNEGSLTDLGPCILLVCGSLMLRNRSEDY